ncbi:MAG: hypothetical protein ACOCN1_08565, partial [Bacteroidales bacterium]
KGERVPIRHAGSALRPAACPWASNEASGFYGFYLNPLNKSNSTFATCIVYSSTRLLKIPSR